jgi:hypothetical protein
MCSSHGKCAFSRFIACKITLFPPKNHSLNYKIVKQLAQEWQFCAGFCFICHHLNVLYFPTVEVVRNVWFFEIADVIEIFYVLFCVKVRLFRVQAQGDLRIGERKFPLTFHPAIPAQTPTKLRSSPLKGTTFLQAQAMRT